MRTLRLLTALQVFRFINAKSEKLFKNKKNPRKIDWTTVYRRMHKKGLVEDTKRKRQRKVAKAPRAIVGLTTEQLFAKRNQSDEARKAAREAVKYVASTVSALVLQGADELFVQGCQGQSSPVWLPQ